MQELLNRITATKQQQQNVFLTATQSIGKSEAQIKPNQQKYLIVDKDQNQVQIVRNNILAYIVDIKAIDNCPEIKQLFNEVLCSLDTELFAKKTIQSITAALRQQTNIIKLKRLLNQLRSMKKQSEKIALTKSYSNKKCIAPKIKQRKTLKPSKDVVDEFSKTLPNQTKQNQEWKNKIYEQISYRQRTQKIQSQNQKHVLNRKLFIHKKLQKVKEMNKKVKQIHDKNRKIQRQKISKYKYEALFDPVQIEQNRKNRGKTMNIHIRDNSYQFQQTPKEPLNRKQGENNPFTDNENQYSHFDLSKNKIKFITKQGDGQYYTKHDLITFKSLKQMIHQSVKGSKSFKSITNKENKKIDLPINKNIKIKMNKSISEKKNCKSFDEKKFEVKLQLVKQKKRQLQQQRYAKIIEQAIQKQQKLLKTGQNNTHSQKNKKKSCDNSLKSSKIRSIDEIPQKGIFKKVFVTRKQLLDKQNRIFMNIQNKVQNKEFFLQERVNKVRQMLKKQQQIRLKHKFNWNQYVSYTENASLLQSRRNSPQRIHQKSTELKNNHKKNSQQFIIKNSHTQNLKKHKRILQQQKLSTLSINELKQKLIQVESKQCKQMNKIIFF